MSPFGVEPHARRRIVHHRRALVGAGDVVVRQAERVPHLVRAHLAHAREHERRVGGRGVGAHQRRVEVVVGARAMRVQARHPLEDLARARVAERAADRPAALVAVLPLHHVVARVHRVGALGEQLGAETHPSARRVRTRRSTSARRRASPAHRLRECPDRCSRRSGCGSASVRIVGIDALEPVARDPALLERALDRLAVVLERDAEVADARIELARAVARRAAAAARGAAAA